MYKLCIVYEALVVLTYLAKLFFMRLDLSEYIFHICNHVCNIHTIEIQLKLVRSNADFLAKMKKILFLHRFARIFYDHIFI